MSHSLRASASSRNNSQTSALRSVAGLRLPSSLASCPCRALNTSSKASRLTSTAVRPPRGCDTRQKVFALNRRQSHRDRVDEDNLVPGPRKPTHQMVLRMRMVIPPILAAETDDGFVCEHSFCRGNNDVPAYTSTEAMKQTIRHESRKKTQVRARHLFDVDLYVAEHFE